MSQALNFSVSGIYTSINDYNGLPPGALDIADNIEVRYKNVAEPRRGFEGLPDSAMDGITFRRLTNFFIGGVDRVIALTSDRELVYYTGANPWPAVPGDVVTNILNPDNINGKSRFVTAGQNLYVTAQDGVRSLSSGPASEMIRAGVPKGLNAESATNGDTSGFFSNNVVSTTTGTVASASALLTDIGDTAGIAVGQYVGGTDIPVGTKIASITPSSIILSEAGDTTAGSATLGSIAGTGVLAVGNLVSGPGIQEGTKIAALPGGGNVTLDTAAYLTATGSIITFESAVIVTMDQNAGGSHSAQTITFYTGAQVGYRFVFGRVETDINGNRLTRLGAPSSVTIATNVEATPTNTEAMATIPKNAENEITFYQLYRSPQTERADLPPLDQYNLVYEADLSPADFIARTITVEDTVPDSLVGIPLYSGSDREGILQANDPPPMCWDMCKFRDFTLFGNITRPTTLRFTVVSVGSPDGIQSGDTITIAGMFLGISFSEVYTAASSEVPASRQFQVFTAGTPSQNITDTTNSLIRVINYDDDLPVHAILLSSASDLPGQILLEADNASYDTFTVDASAHQDAYDPELDNVESEINTINNGIAVSKSGELEAVPATNLFPAGDTSSDLLRLIPLRDYVIALKTDGVYKVQGLTPGGLVVSPFDLTTKIIGADTAVALNSAVWMMSNQGVVSISDGGTDAKSVPIDDQLNRLVGSFLDTLVNVAFAVGYESDRKYILYTPESNTPFAQIEYNFNYITNAWTTWSRNFHAAYIHSNEGKMYVSCADADINTGISRERKSATYQDFVDEAIDVTVVSVDGTEVVLSDVSRVEVGDILYQGGTFSPILAVDLATDTISLQYNLDFTPGAAQVLAAYQCTLSWKQVFGTNPAFMRQFSEGVALFKNTRFNVATARFVTDFSSSDSPVTLTGNGNGLWGLFAWGEIPWGGSTFPSKLRFYIPQEKQLGSYLLPTLEIKQGYSDFKFQGLAIAYFDISLELGL